MITGNKFEGVKPTPGGWPEARSRGVKKKQGGPTPLTPRQIGRWFEDGRR